MPTIWLGVLDYAKRENYDLSSLKTIVVGGAPPPQALIEGMDELGVSVIHCYALSETSCVQVTVTRDWPRTRHWPKEVQFAKRARQGIPGPAGDARVLNEKMKEVQWNGREIGGIYFRSPGMTSEIYQDPECTARLFRNGWFDSEDLGTVDEDGYIAIVDRSKDLVKSGGEWISSVYLENIIMAHPAVLEACVVAVPHEKWQERPIAWVVPKENYKDKLTKEEVLKFLEGKVSEGRLARWWLPDEIVFVAEIPKTGTGKFNKKAIRAKYWNKEVR